jgi:hypothetical protein
MLATSKYGLQLTLAAWLAPCVVCSGFAAGVVPDGGTRTSVSTAASGHQTVNIAPVVGAVSHNTYSHSTCQPLALM